MKKLASMFLAAALMAMCLAACGGDGSSTPQQSSGSASSSTPGSSSAPGGSAINFDEEPYHLVVCYPVLSEAQADLQLIQDAINEITLREINATVEFEAVSLFSMANIYNMKASSQEKMDLMMLMPGTSYLSAFAASNMIQPIGEEIDEWGPAIKEVLGQQLGTGAFKGQQYAIPQNKDYLVNGYGYQLLQAVCDENDIDTAAIKTMEDLEAAFATIKQNEPEMIVLVPEQSGGSIITSVVGKIDGLGTTNIAALEVQSDGSMKAVISQAREEYMAGALKVHEWYNQGYISRDVTTAQESGSQMQWAGRAFASSSAGLGSSMGDITNGIVRRSIMFDDSSLFLTTSDSQMSIWTVPTSCQRPEKAVQFINLAFESEEIGNLFRYGIEGNHYKVLDDGSVELTNTAGWQNNWYILGDYNKMYVRNDVLVTAGGISLEEFQELRDDWNSRVVTSPAYGFTFDPSSVRNEIAACDAVTKEYGAAIGNGTVNPEVELPIYLEKLNNAGIQTVIDEVQRQLDEWAAAQ